IIVGLLLPVSRAGSARPGAIFIRGGQQILELFKLTLPLRRLRPYSMGNKKENECKNPIHLFEVNEFRICYQKMVSLTRITAIPATAEEITIFQSRRFTLKNSVRTKPTMRKTATTMICPSSRPRLKARS